MLKASTHSESVTICVLLPNWVGDACMATPALRALRSAYPAARIVAVMRPVIAELLDQAWGDAQPWFDEVILLAKRKATEGVSKWELGKLLRKKRINVALLLTNSLWSAAVMRVAGATRIVGYDRDARGWLLTDRLPVPRQRGSQGRGKYLPISAVDYYQRITHWIGCESSDRHMQLHADSRDLELAEQLWNQCKFSPQVPTIAINSGAASSATRLWPLHQVQSLAWRIADELKWQVLLHCGPAERDAMNRLAAEANHPRIASMGRMRDLPIGLSKAALGQATAVVSTDSGPRHIAVAMDRPVVSLFGPTQPAWTTTYNRPEAILGEDLSCRGCYRSPCPLGHHACMRNISVARVFAALKSCVDGLGTSAAANSAA